MDIGGLNFTNFENVRLTGGRRGTAVLRFTNMSSTEGTLQVGELEAARYWTLPNKSGTLPIMGTFAIQLPALAATTFVQSTVATVGGIRTEDGLVLTINRGTTAGYGAVNNGTSGATARIFHSAEAGNGQITVNFLNFGVATGYVELVASYAAVR